MCFPSWAYNKEPETGIHPAEIGTGPVNRTDCLHIVAEPEKRACIGTQRPDILGAEEILFVMVHHNHGLISCRHKPEPEFHGPDFIPDAYEISHGTATFPALLTPECH